MYNHHLRSAQSGAAAVARARFKAPLLAPRRPVDIIALIPSDTIGICAYWQTGHFEMRILPPVTSLADDPTGVDASEIIEAELAALSFRSGELWCEWPLPQQAEKYAKNARIARDGAVIAARKLGLSLHNISQAEVAKAFGAQGAAREPIEVAMRETGLGFDTTTTHSKGVMAAAFSLVAGLEQPNGGRK